jgi:16S rRNA (uracil1498-N3)-methyltransferase
MRRFYLPEIDSESGRAALTGTEHHHARNVLRLEMGEEISVLDGRGREFVCRIESMDKKIADLAIIREIRAAAPESPLDLTLAAVAIPGEKYDLVIQKAAELGVTTFVPLTSARCELKLKEITRKYDRWQRIILDASKQCGRAKLMDLQEPRPILNYLASIPIDGDSFFFSERDGEAFPSELNTHGITAVVGPKGGWDTSEIDAAKAAGFRIVTLGGRILRAETAAISLTAILQHRFGDLN